MAETTLSPTGISALSTGLLPEAHVPEFDEVALSQALRASRAPRDPESQRAALLGLVAAGLDRLPSPGGGRTWTRWSALAEVAAVDLCLARLYEGHTDALAVFDELGAIAPAGRLLGVWASASGRTGLDAQLLGDGAADVEGSLRFCSGARVIDEGLAIAASDSGRVLVRLDLADPHVVPVEGSWAAIGMDASDSVDVRVSPTVAPVIGEPETYYARRGFWLGGLGVAAVWWGGARAIVDNVRATLATHGADPHQAAHLAAMTAAVEGSAALLRETAHRVDHDGELDVETTALLVRHHVATTAELVLARAGHALGATPLCRDRSYAQRVADLGVYTRQQHDERDLERAGRRLLGPAS